MQRLKAARHYDEAMHVCLRDGTTIIVRRLEPDDFDAVMQLHQRFTERETYMRFFVAHPARLDKFMHELVECDETQCAVGGFEAGQLIGVANYALSSEPGLAEVAVAVAHEDHLRGVATVLLKRLGEVAISNGIHTFTADVLVENTGMLKVISDVGWRHTSQFDGPVLDITIDLSGSKDPYARGAVNDL
jgi:RimJ/RimL family protein N-acetyltransferase